MQEQVLMVRSKPDPKIGIVERHTTLLSRLLQNDRWCLTGTLPSLPDDLDQLAVIVDLDPYLQDGITGRISYRNRRCLENTAMNDDYIVLNFPASRTSELTFYRIASAVLPAYVSTFDAYRADIATPDLILRDYGKGIATDARFQLERIYPALYLSSDLCNRLFGYPPVEAVQRLLGIAYECQEWHRGLHLIASAEELSPDAADAFDQRAFTALIEDA